MIARPLAREALAALALVLAHCAYAAPVRLYVGPSGDDRAGGRTPESAFATPAKARDAARALRLAEAAPEGIEIVLAPGTYVLREPVEFGPEDAGSAAAPLVVRGSGDGESVLCAGPVVSGFTPYRGSILKLDLRAAGLGGVKVRQVLADGRRLPLARVPNIDPEDIHGGTWAHALDGAGEDTHFGLKWGLDVDASRWAHPTDGRVGIFCRFAWRWNRLPVKAVDTERRTLSFARRATYEIQPGDRYFVEGLFEELDAPGEWYCDPRTETLYVWPPESDSGRRIVVGVSPGLIRLQGTQHVTIRGLTFEGGTGTAVGISDCTNCSIEASRIDSPDGWAVTISGGSGCTVSGCDIAWTGHGGIALSGGDRDTLTKANNQAVNNVIHNNGCIEKTYNTGINISGVGNRAAHNLIFDTPHAGMTLSGNDNIVELNHVHHTNLQSADTGGIYSCPRDWTQRGNLIRYNLWHDIGGYGKESAWQPVKGGVATFVYPHFTWGIYMDDPTSGNTIFGNILYRVPLCALHNHGGRDNVFDNNVIVDCMALNAGALNPGWGEWVRVIERFRAVTGPGSPYLDAYPALREYTEEHPEAMSGMRFRHNIVAFTREGTEWLRHEKGWGTTQRLYQLRMREEDFSSNVFERNLIYVPEGLDLAVSLHRLPGTRQDLTWEQWRATGADKGTVLADPKFVDAATLDFRLRPDSPAWDLGFQEIPVDRIGPQEEPRRASWPIKVRSFAATRAKPIRQEIELYPKLPARPYTVRGGLPRTQAKLASGEPLRIAYFGGGIHSAGGWRKQVLNWLAERAPEADITEIDAGICDCVRGSGFSVFRFRHDVLDREPDLVLVDFASDDHQTPYPAVQRAVEGIVRQAWERDPTIDLLFLYAFRAGFEEDYSRELCPSAVSAYQAVADWYGVPSVNMGYSIAQGVSAGTVSVRGEPGEGQTAFSTDGVRPTAAGNTMYADSVIAALPELLAGAHAASARAPLKEPLVRDNLQDARQLAITADMLTGKWEKVDSGPDWDRCKRHFDSLWATHTPGARLEFTFNGTDASLFRLIGPTIGKIRVSVDGKEVGVRATVDRWCYYNRLSALPLAANLDPGEHSVTVELLPDPPNRDEPEAEAKRLDRYEPGMFEGVGLMVGAIRIVGPVQ